MDWLELIINIKPSCGEGFKNGADSGIRLGFAPRSESFAFEPSVQHRSISSLSGLTHFVRVVRPQIRRTQEKCLRIWGSHPYYLHKRKEPDGSIS